ncbi:YrhA family protein [Metabacillus fastidiosus]|uniref:YrhA family protein n=1 Tax=Metabacillus fastidiosus TaxID=1458 RepID=UPI002DBE3778|nr:YrhA family protein [Metabacillus fastidiosus]MEC2077210.1 YrhA family protein [Metabacillus fastidiosus]
MIQNIKLKEVSNMWREKLIEIKREKVIYNELINDGAADEQIEKLIIEVENVFHYKLPKEYLSFLSLVNGLEFNGFIIYGVDSYLLSCKVNQQIIGLISSNKIWYENEEQKQYIFLGESNISWYCFDLIEKKFIELDNPSGELISKYTDFETMLDKILEDSLL